MAWGGLYYSEQARNQRNSNAVNSKMAAVRNINQWELLGSFAGRRVAPNHHVTQGKRHKLAARWFSSLLRASDSFAC